MVSLRLGRAGGRWRQQLGSYRGSRWSYLLRISTRRSVRLKRDLQTRYILRNGCCLTIPEEAPEDRARKTDDVKAVFWSWTSAAPCPKAGEHDHVPKWILDSMRAPGPKRDWGISFLLGCEEDGSPIAPTTSPAKESPWRQVLIDGQHLQTKQ